MTAHSPRQNAERLLQLSNEVSRIAGTLAQLSTQPALAALTGPPDIDADPRPISPDVVMRVIRARRLRSRFFPDNLFADPAWDMMLALLHAELMQRRLSVSQVCASAGVPATTALRWLTTMAERDLFVRRSDPRDGRRVFVELSAQTSDALKRYFAERSEFHDEFS